MGMHHGSLAGGLPMNPFQLARLLADTRLEFYDIGPWPFALCLSPVVMLPSEQKAANE